MPSLTSDTLTYITEDTPDFNQLVGRGFNVTAKYVASVDFNALSKEGIEWVSDKISSNSVSNSAYESNCLVVY